VSAVRPIEDQIRRHQWRGTPAFRARLLRAILRREATDPGLQVSNVQGWHSSPDLLAWGDAPVAPLLRRIRADAGTVGAARLRIEAWANVMRTGAYQVAHRHGRAVWSGVYYVEASEGSGGEITFARGTESITISPRTGLMLLFPGDLLHSVAPYVGSGIRISVAFNLS
jgi:hypothetical protein